MVLIFLGTSGDKAITDYSFQTFLPSTDPIDLEIEGFILDYTQSKVGRDFYDEFYTNWNPPDNLPKLPIVVSEKPLPRQGSQIVVSVDDEIIFERFIQPKQIMIEENVALAIQIAYGYLQNYSQMQSQIEGDDLTGSGIY